MENKLLTTKEAAQLLGLSIRTLERYRQYEEGPAFLKQGHRVFYTLDDLSHWQAQNKRLS